MEGLARSGPSRPIPIYRFSRSDEPGDIDYWDGARAILDDALAMFGPRLTVMLDRLSRAWLRRRGARELPELDAIAKKTGRPGVYLMNLSFEWSCSVSIGPGRDGAVSMRRVFDWGPPSLGPALCEVRRDADRPYTALTWPMFVGEATVIAPHRFAIALNRAPGPGEWAEYDADMPLLGRLIDTASFLLSRAEPPAHLLRRIAETAPDAGSAIDMLLSDKLCRNAIFMVAAPDIAKSGRVERRGNDGAFAPAPCLATNHFQDVSHRGSNNSRHRLETLRQCCGGATLESWLAPPILNDQTRFVSVIRMPDGRHFTQAIDRSRCYAEGGDLSLRDY